LAFVISENIAFDTDFPTILEAGVSNQYNQKPLRK